MKKLSAYIWKNKLRYILAIGSMILAVSLDLMSPQLTKHIIDDVIQAKADASPQFQLGEHIIRRYQECLYLTGKFADLSQTCLDLPAFPHLR